MEKLSEYQRKSRHSKLKVSATQATPILDATQEQTMQKLLSNLKNVTRLRKNTVKDTVG